MKQLSPTANTAMRLAIAASGVCNLAVAAINADALNAALPAWPATLLALQVANGLLVAGLSFACVWLMGEA